MARLQPTLSDTDFENWVRSGLSLQYTKDGIEMFVDTIIGNLHQTILNNCPSRVTCTNCATENIVKCERNNNFCKFVGRACVVHDPSNINKRHRPCPSNVCDQIRNEIIINHRYNKPAWQNTDARLWCTNRWIIAVCYMSVGYSQTRSASETDLPGLLNVIINNTYFQTYITDNLSDDNNIFRQARTSRNDLLHNPRQRLTDVELRAHIVTFTAVLSDAKTLSTDTNAIAAITKLQQILNNTIRVTTQHAGQIFAEAFNSIKEAKDIALDAIKGASDTITENIKKTGQEELKPITDAKDNALDVIKGANDTITENIKKSGQEALKPITEAKDKALDEMKGASDTITENLKKDVDDVKNLKETTIKYIVDKTKEFDIVSDEASKYMTDALKSMKETDDEITENIKKKGEESEKRTLKRIAEEGEKSLDAIKKTKFNHIESIKEKSKQLTIEHSETLIERKNELVAEITNAADKDRTQDQSSITEIRQELVLLYQTEVRFLTTPLYPLIQTRNRNIEDLYVTPLMRTVEKETLKPDKEVNSLEDIFRDNSKNIYVVGDAGMGKSALCKKILSDWCKSKSDNETDNTFSTDQKAMKKFSFVFYISLRDINTDLKIIDMIEEICGCDDKTLKFILRNEKCLIVLDGLDEWTPKVIPNTANSSYSSVNIPSRDKVRTCSILTTTRPWKLEAIRLESSQIDKQIELLGIGEDSHKAFIQYMVKQMDPDTKRDFFCLHF